MPDRTALQIALDLLHIPSQVRFVRAAPLPDGMVMLLRIAAGDEEAEASAAALTDRPRDIVRQAATFFIEQILFAPSTDSYRILGASPQASAGELRRNLALLSKWLHPDRNTHDDRSIFIDRVTAAWNDLKTPERRAVYDKARRGAMNHGKSQGAKGNQPGRDAGSGNDTMRGRYHAGDGKTRRKLHHGRRIGLLRLLLVTLFQRPER